MSKNNIRKLKCSSECVKEKDEFLHPISIFPVINQDKEKKCASNNLKDFKLYTKCDGNIELEQLKKHMEVPFINIELNHILEFYKINTIDDLTQWIDNNINNKPFDTINRVLNLWICENIRDLKNFNNILFSIIKKLLNFYFTDIKEELIDNELKDFIDYWINKFNIDDFEFNLISDFKKFLNKKYDR